MLKKLIYKNENELNIWIVLLPLLILYLFIIIIFAPNNIFSDEKRYFAQAVHLANGTFNKLDTRVALLNGPGYPIIISIFLLLKLPVFFIRLLNGFLLYIAQGITYKTIRIYSPQKKALFFTILLCLYYPVFEMLPLIFTEVLTWLFISLSSYLFIRAIKDNNLSWKHIILSSFSIAYLIMIKVIFGYVVIVMLLVTLIWWLLGKSRLFARRSFITLLLSLIFCIPYLYYTYSKTGRIFYWSSAGSNTLYTMSSPFENEYGDWLSDEFLISNPNHADFMKKTDTLNFIERDEAFREKAIDNIRNHPNKYLENWAANIGRLFFSYPKSYAYQDMNLYYTILPTIFIVVFMIISILLSIYKFKYVPNELIFLSLFFLTYLFGSSLVSASRRSFYITMPFWLILISFVFTNIITVKVNNKS